MQFSSHWIAIGALICCAACGNPQMPASQIQSAESAYSQALEAQQSQDYATALEHFHLAIDEAGLNADLLSDALLRSADCHVELGNLDDAAAILDELEANAPEMDQFHLVRCKLHAKQGDSTKARAAFDAAREVNPAVEPPVQLN